jgi:hypothetical protein
MLRKNLAATPEYWKLCLRGRFAILLLANRRFKFIKKLIVPEDKMSVSSNKSSNKLWQQTTRKTILVGAVAAAITMMSGHAAAVCGGQSDDCFQWCRDRYELESFHCSWAAYDEKECKEQAEINQAMCAADCYWDFCSS